MKEYFVIINGDGDTHVYHFTYKELIEFLEDNNPGSFIEEIPSIDTHYWDGKFLIIKGETIIPERTGWSVK